MRLLAAPRSVGRAVFLAHRQPQHTFGPSWSVRWDLRLSWLTANRNRPVVPRGVCGGTRGFTGSPPTRNAHLVDPGEDTRLRPIRLRTVGRNRDWPMCFVCSLVCFVSCLFVCLWMLVSRVGVHVWVFHVWVLDSRLGGARTTLRRTAQNFVFFFPLPPHFRSFFSSRPEFHEEPWGHWVKPGGCRPPGGPHFFWIWPPTLRAPLFLGWGSLSRPPCVFSVFLGCFLVVSSPTPPHSTFNEALPFVKGHGPYLVRMRPSLSVLSRNILFLGCSRVICGTNRN